MERIKKSLCKPNAGDHMFIVIALLFACIGIFAITAAGLYVVLALWFGLGVTYAGCCVMTVILFILAVIEMVKNARELDED
jgi:hypothetical protein